MATLSDIETLPRAIMGQGWLLWQTRQDMPIGELAKLASKATTRKDSDLRLSATVLPAIARDVTQMPAESSTIAFAATRPITDLVVAYLPAIAPLLAEGFTQAEVARKLCVSRSHVCNEITRCRSELSEF